MLTPSKKSKQSFEIDDLILHPNIIFQLKYVGLLTYKSILHLSLIELQKLAKLTALEAKITLEAISNSLVTNETLTVYDLLNKETSHQELLRITSIDSSPALFNGIYTGTITEICGESGCGKTQLCLHLSILAQLPLSLGGLNSKVIYIHSEGEFPIKRFLQMASSFTYQNPCLKPFDLSNNLILRKVHNLNSALHIIKNGIPQLMPKFNPKLLIIDSVGSLLRSDFESISDRTTTIQNFGAQIWKLANFFGMAVVCVNQVSGQFKKNETTSASFITDVPSLGLLWSNLLTTRLKVFRKGSPPGQTTRVLENIFSSYIPSTSLDFVITETGIRFCNDTES